MSERLLPDETPFSGVPYVGCAATIPVGSDCYPATVVWVSDRTTPVEVEAPAHEGLKTVVRMPKRIRVRECRHRGVEGHDNAYTENQRYEYYEAPEDADYGKAEAHEYSWRERRRGYVQVGTPSRSTAAQRLGLGHRRAYYDPSF